MTTPSNETEQQLNGGKVAADELRVLSARSRLAIFVAAGILPWAAVLAVTASLS